MFFWKIDEETIRCLISRQEIDSMGFDIGSLTNDAEQMGAFLEAIVRNSQNYIDWHTENGIQNYVARSLPSDQFLITISCTFQDVAIDRNLDQIQRMTHALNKKISQERIDQIYALSGEEKEQAFAKLSKDLHDVCIGNLEEEDVKEEKESGVFSEKKETGGFEDIQTAVSKTAVQKPGKNGVNTEEAQEPKVTISDKKLEFKHLSEAIRFCSMLDKRFNFTSTLYKWKDSYVMLVDFSKCKDNVEAVNFLIMAEEYGASCSEVYFDRYYLTEHAQMIIDNDAIEILKAMG